MSYVRLSRLLQLDRLRPDLRRLRVGSALDRAFRDTRPELGLLDRQRRLWPGNALVPAPCQNSGAAGTNGPGFAGYGRRLRYFAYFTAAACAFAKTPEDSANKNDDRESDAASDLDTELPPLDPFDDEAVVYFHKNYSYESPSKDNRVYYEIKKVRYPASKTKIPDSIESEFDSFFVNPFYGYYKRLRDQVNSVVDTVTPLSPADGEPGERHMEPFWVVLSNTAPTAFSNAFMLVCGGVFALWKLADNTVHSKLSEFMNRHFLASYEAFKAKRYHTLLTSGRHASRAAISHSSLMHFMLNCMFFHQLMKTFQNNMALYATANVNSSLQSFLRSVFASSATLEGGRKAGAAKGGRVNTNDIFNVMFLSSIASSLGHVYLYKTPVLGASGAISGLMYLLAATFPNSYFRTVFPLPGLNLSILQIGQIFVATNLYFLANGSRANIAWAAHLIGMGAGALYCFFQQYVNRRPGFHNAFALSARTARAQWARTFQGFGKA